MCVLQVLHSMVSSVERPPTTPAGSQLIIRCKDFRIIQILIPQERDCMDVHASLVRLSRPGMCLDHWVNMCFRDLMCIAAMNRFGLTSSLLSEKYSELYCLSFNPNVNKEEREESWNFIDLTEDYKRMGVPNNLWLTTAANSEYRVSPSFRYLSML